MPPVCFPVDHSQMVAALRDLNNTSKLGSILGIMIDSPVPGQSGTLGHLWLG